MHIRVFKDNVRSDQVKSGYLISPGEPLAIGYFSDTQKKKKKGKGRKITIKRGQCTYSNVMRGKYNMYVESQWSPEEIFSFVLFGCVACMYVCVYVCVCVPC